MAAEPKTASEDKASEPLASCYTDFSVTCPEECQGRSSDTPGLQCHLVKGTRVWQSGYQCLHSCVHRAASLEGITLTLPWA